MSSRIEPLVEKFAPLKNSQLLMTLEMENSPEKAGPDLFKIKLRILGGRYTGLQLEKSAQSLYVALADLTEHLLEAINRRVWCSHLFNIKITQPTGRFSEKTRLA